MAERIEGATEPKRRRWYPWRDWMDGAVWRAVAGKDFTCTTGSFQTALHQRARHDGVEVVTGSPEPGIVEFQFTLKAAPAAETGGPVLDQDALAAGWPIDVDEYDAPGANDPDIQ